MSNYYKLAGSKNPTTDWTAEVILEKDDDGNVTKSVGANKPAQLSQEDRDKLEALGYEVESSSKQEADEAEQQAVVASSSQLGTAPLVGDQSQNQPVSDVDQSGDNTKNS